MTDIKWTVKVTGPGTSLDREVPEVIASRVAVLVLSGSDSGEPLSSAAHGGATPPKTLSKAAGLSIREYLDGCATAKRFPQQMAVIGNYLTDAGKPSFLLSDLLSGFEDAKEPPPKNAHRDLGKAIKAGWIAPKSGDKGTYYVTGTGSAAVKNGFPKISHKKKAAKKGKK